MTEIGKDPKVLLRFYYDELKKLKENYDPHAIFSNATALRDYCLKLDLPYSKRGILITDIQSLVESSFKSKLNEIEHKDNPKILQMDKEYLTKIIDTIIYQLDSTIRHPEEIKLKPLPTKNKKGVFDFFKKKRSVKNKTVSNIQEKKLDVNIEHQEFQGIMKVFISHTIKDENEEKLASILQKILADKKIEGYIAENKKEYDQYIKDKIIGKILESDHMVAIITTNATESASVNQEIGYALRDGIKPIIMREKDTKIGVLTFGLDTEDFTRDTFDQSCYKILNYIIKKGPRRKLKEEEIRELIQNVYRPCYDQMMNVYGRREFLTYITENPWEKITPSWRLKTEPEIKQLFDLYTQECKKWSDMWIIDFGNKFQSKEKMLSEILKSTFEKFHLLDQEGRLNFGGTTSSPQNWLHNFREVIFNDKLVNGNELYKFLKWYGIRRWGEEYAKTLDEWIEKNPEIYDELLKQIPELVKELGAKFSYTEIDKQRNVLKELIEKLTLTLEEKLK